MTNVLEIKTQEAISLIKPNSIYFAHPINTYNTKEEKSFIETISKRFSQFNIYNPNQIHNEENYKLWKKETGSGMKYYFDVILPHMDAGIFLPFEDGMFGAGVFGEAEFLQHKGKPLWFIDWNKNIYSIKELDKSKRLSVDETRKRIYGN